MTLGEGEYSESMNVAYKLEAGSVLRDVLFQAKLEKRITCGVYQAASKLSMSPKSVMMCIQADDSTRDDVLHMHFALMKAFCWENTIPLLKVSNQGALYELLKDMEVPPDCTSEDEEEAEDGFVERENVAVTFEDTVCVLIEVQKEKTELENVLLHHHHSMTQFTPSPTIRLAT